MFSKAEGQYKMT